MLFFFSLAQPPAILPNTEEYRIFFLLSLFASLLFVLKKFSTSQRFVSLPQNKFILLILFAYTLSEAQFFYLSGALQVLVYWGKKIILYYLIINTLESIGDFRKLIWSFVFAVLVLTYYAWQLYFTSPQSLFHLGRLQSLGNYNNPNSFAFLLTLSFPIAFSLMEIEVGILKKGFLAAFLFILALSAIYTKSRAGALGMMIAAIFSFLLSPRLLKSRTLKISMSVIVITVFLLFAMTLILARSDTTSFLGAHGEASSGDRLLAWTAAIRMFSDHPFLGVGWGHFTEYVRAYGHDKKIIAHNTPLSLLAETGIFGFTCFSAILFISFKELLSFRHQYKHDKSRQDFLILVNGVYVSLVCFVVNSSFSVKDHDPVYWALLTLAALLCVIYRKIDFSDQCIVST